MPAIVKVKKSVLGAIFAQSLFVFWIFSNVALGAAEEKTLYICNWTNYISPLVIQAFEKETGIKVYWDALETSEVLETKLLAARSGYDVVFPSAWPELPRLIQSGALQPLDAHHIPNQKNLDPKVMNKLKKADRQGIYALPYLWGTTGFVVNTAAVKKLNPKAPLASLRMLFDIDVLKTLPRKSITFLDSPNEVFDLACLYLGLNLEEESKENLEKATHLLSQVWPFVQKCDSFQFVQKIASEENILAHTWSSYGNMTREKAKNPQNISYVLPKEGCFFWIDIMVIPKDAPHKNNAHKFINFILKPQMMALNTNHTQTANAVPNSRSWISQDILANPVIYPDNSMWEKFHINSSHSPSYQKQKVRAWTKIKTGL